MAAPLIPLAIGLVSKAIDKIFPDPAARQAAKLKLMEMQESGDLAELEAATKTLVAEMTGSNLQRNWRPITMLVFVAIIANNYIIAPYIGLFFGAEWSLELEVPQNMWDLMKIGLGGYVMGRSGEKIMREYKGN